MVVSHTDLRPMDLAEARQKLEQAEVELATQPLAVFADFDTIHGKLRVFITDRLRRKCRRAHIWKSPKMLTALKNARYGFDPKVSRSRSGRDGIFRVDRDFRPKNSMMIKLFNQFIDKPDPLIPMISKVLRVQPTDWIPVRLVSHHIRLLGVISVTGGTTQLVLVDYDNDKRD